ncbi:MAG: TonB-dependent receptor, partial [Sandarakinorhabdus sp.]|nr:TonB-dependent receptor [Sandarakinorhabdus sp.]
MPTTRAILLLASCFAPIALAPATAKTEAAGGQDVHRLIGPDIIVTAPFKRERFALPTAAGVLAGEALARETRSTIGETLARQPGVS